MTLNGTQCVSEQFGSLRKACWAGVVGCDPIEPLCGPGELGTAAEGDGLVRRKKF